MKKAVTVFQLFFGLFILTIAVMPSKWFIGAYDATVLHIGYRVLADFVMTASGVILIGDSYKSLKVDKEIE